MEFTLLCNVDFQGHDIFPYLETSTYENCINACNVHNKGANNETQCLAAVFVPARIAGADDCYLKSSIENPTLTSGLVGGAVLGGLPDSPHWSSASTSGNARVSSEILNLPQTTPTATSVDSASASSTLISSGSSAYQTVYAQGLRVITPSLVSTTLHGPTFNQPTSQYIDFVAPAGTNLTSNLLSPGINRSLTTKYPISLETGILELNSTTESLLAQLDAIPQLSRDGGKGGLLGGKHIFVFCDTGSYTNGSFLGFVSGSVAVDTGMNAVEGQPIGLQDGIGEWSDNVGRMRGLTPLTEGEQSYNIAMQGQGYRYAVWVESSFIPLQDDQAVILAPLVYDTVDFTTRAANFTYAGATLLMLSAGGPGGPIASRVVDLMFYAEEVEWGCIGGIRSWGPSGVGGSDGMVYLFGKAAGGLLLARTNATSVADRSSVSP